MSDEGEIMRTFEELLRESTALHGHHCAGQVLGVRLAMAGCREVGIDEPKGCKKLIVYVEIDRCATDAIQAVTGCSLGRRTLKFLDYGKMAATFVNLETRRAIRLVAREEARERACFYVPQAAAPREAQKLGYAVMPDDELFSIRPAAVEISDEDMPGFRGGRTFCTACGEGINFNRYVCAQDRALCIPCAARTPLPVFDLAASSVAEPAVVLVTGRKKTGKTTLIEKLVLEFSRRGYRVGTVKHHHSNLPVVIDTPGTDSWRHRRAGAAGVALVTPTDLAFFCAAQGDTALDRILGTMRQHDIVIVEGFHRERRAKIEVWTPGAGDRLCSGDENLLAVVTPAEVEDTVPTFRPDDIHPLADLIERKISARSRTAVTTNPAGVPTDAKAQQTFF